MTDTLPDPPELDPAVLAGTVFARARKGFDAAEVGAALGRASDALRVWELRDRQLLARIEDLEKSVVESHEMDEQRIVTVLGEETARIVAAARDAAAEIRSKAEDQASRLLRETEEQATSSADALTTEATELRDAAQRSLGEATDEADRLRSDSEAAAERLVADATQRHDELLAEAESLLAVRTAEAELVAAGLVESAASELSDAEIGAVSIRSVAEAAAADELDRAREDGRSMVAEAKSLRERMLADLAERRRTARRQIEGARGGRDRIVEALRSAVVDVAGTIDGLEDMDSEIQQAADTSAGLVDDDIDQVVAELEAELGGRSVTDDARSDDLADAGPEMATGYAVGEIDVVEVTRTIDVDLDGAVTGTVEVAEVEITVVEDSSARVIGMFDGETTPGDLAEVTDHGAGADDDDEDEEGDGAYADDPVPIDSGRDTAEGDGSDTDISEVDGADTDESGATVHDLFARIRAEGLDDEAPDVEGPGADGSDTTATAEEEKADDGAAGEVDPLSALLDRRDRALVPVEKQLSRSLRRLASDEQNGVLDQLRRVKRGRPEITSVLESPESTLQQFTDTLLADFTTAVEAGSEFWAEVAGSSTDSLFSDDARIRDTLAATVGDFLAVHRAHLERTFAESEEEGLDIADLGDRVRASYRDWRSTSLAELAGDLATAGFTQGERIAAGPGTPWMWVVDNGGLPCADGEDNALAGAVPCEEPFPTGDITPPAHAGCRCILLPAHR